MDKQITLNPNEVVAFLQKRPQEFTRDDMLRFICEKGIDLIAQKNGGYVIFINPLKSWDKEEYGVYEMIMAETMVAQTGFSHGPHGSCVRTIKMPRSGSPTYI